MSELLDMLEVFTFIVDDAKNLIKVQRRMMGDWSSPVRLHLRSYFSSTPCANNSGDNPIKKPLANQFLDKAKPWSDACLSRADDEIGHLEEEMFSAERTDRLRSSAERIKTLNFEEIQEHNSWLQEMILDFKNDNSVTDICRLHSGEAGT